MFWVYVLENPRGKFYVSQTQDLAARLCDWVTNIIGRRNILPELLPFSVGFCFFKQEIDLLREF